MGVVFKEPHIITNLLYPMLPEPKDYNFTKKKYVEFVEKGAITRKDFWNALGIKNWKSFENKYLENFEIDPDFFKVADYLKRKYQLAVLSDLAVTWGNFLIKKYKLDKIFCKFFFSEKYKMCKKQKEFFLLAMRNLKLNGKECCMIDDRLSVLKLASQLKMKTIWFKREKKGIEFNPGYTITKFEELKRIL